MRKHGTKSSLLLMELIVVILFFSLCAAICMQVFAAAKLRSRDARALSGAVLAAESAAECYKAAGDGLDGVQALFGGDRIQDTLVLGYDADWQSVETAPDYLLCVVEANQGAHLVVNRVSDGETIYTLDIKVVSDDGQ